MARQLLSDVTEALFARVAAFAEANGFDDRVAYPDVAFTPPDRKRNDDVTEEQAYLSVNVLPNTSELDGFSFESELNEAGLLAVNVVWPAGQGVLPAVRLAEEVAGAFAPGTVVTRNGVSVRVYEQPRIAPALPGDGVSTIPVTVRWVAWV